MKSLLLPLITAVALPISANAASTWLILRYQSGYSITSPVALEKIEMEDLEQCELEGAKWMGAKESKVEKARTRGFSFTCLQGK
tara:strand:- start:335 stop:586 length:252 start_codon:yes stop_codon:yes gene_type:complete